MQKQQKRPLSPSKTAEATRSYQTSTGSLIRIISTPMTTSRTLYARRLEGKQPYLDLIQQVLAADQTAKILCRFTAMRNMNMRLIQIHFVLSAETLLVLSRLSLSEIEHIFHAPEDIFPSDIGKNALTLHSRLLLSENMAIYCQRKLFIEGGAFCLLLLVGLTGLSLPFSHPLNHTAMRLIWIVLIVVHTRPAGFLPYSLLMPAHTACP